MKKKKKNCLDTLEEIKDLVKNQKDSIEEVEDEKTTKPKDPPEDPPLPLYPEGKDFMAQSLERSTISKQIAKVWMVIQISEKNHAKDAKKEPKEFLKKWLEAQAPLTCPTVN